MTDYDRDSGPYTPPEKYNPKPSWDQVCSSIELNEYLFSFEETESLLTRDKIREDLQKGKCGLDVGLLYDVLEYMNEQLCYK
jgi:hypothetical protein